MQPTRRDVPSRGNIPRGVERREFRSNNQERRSGQQQRVNNVAREQQTLRERELQASREREQQARREPELRANMHFPPVRRTDVFQERPVQVVTGHTIPGTDQVQLQEHFALWNNRLVKVVLCPGGLHRLLMIDGIQANQLVPSSSLRMISRQEYVNLNRQRSL